MTEPAPAKQKRIPSRIYVDIRKMIDPETGELVGCLVPAGNVDREILQIEGFEGYLIRRVARSLAFDEMEEGDFQSLVKQICNHIAEKYLPTLTPDQVAEAIKLMPDDPT